MGSLIPVSAALLQHCPQQLSLKTDGLFPQGSILPRICGLGRLNRSGDRAQRKVGRVDLLLTTQNDGRVDLLLTTQNDGRLDAVLELPYICLLYTSDAADE